MAIPELDAFSHDYAEARARFRAAAGTARARQASYALDRTGPAGEALACDVARLGPDGAERALVLVSGTHGIEGFAGSALQIQLLTRERAALPDDLAVVLVHALNPFGFAHLRRVNEDNVDINRNFVDHARPPHNDAYELVHEALVPDAWEGPAREEADRYLLGLVRERGMPFVQTAVTGGQYRHPDGLFYGGAAPVWSNRTWRAIVREHLRGLAAIAYIDLHTGLGERGRPEPIFRGGRDAGALSRARAWYGDALTLSEDGSASSTPIIGNTASALADELGDGVELTAITLELGTEPPLSVLNALRGDQWLRLRGDPEGPEAAGIAEAMDRAFRPSDTEWRQAVFAEGRRFAQAAVRGLWGGG